MSFLWACAEQTTSANVLEKHLFNEPSIKGEEQDCSSIVALLESAGLFKRCCTAGECSFIGENCPKDIR